MSYYSIKDIEQLSGIKAHTLRIWEQRYNILKPRRTDTNIRYYDADDLKFILNISFLNKHGYKISKIAQMPQVELRDEVLKLTDQSTKYDDRIEALTLCMLDLDELKFEQILTVCTHQNGFESTILNLVYPFLNRIGVLWQTGAITPAQEHFISNLVRQKLIVAIDSQSIDPEKYHNAQKYLLFLPENELHELGLLFASYLLRKKGQRVIYLGQALPFEDLKRIYHTHQPAYLLCTLTTMLLPEQIQIYLNQLGDEFKKTKVLVSGNQLIGQGFDMPENMLLLNKMQDLIDFIESNTI